MSDLCDWLVNVTGNDIQVIYVTAHRFAGGLKELNLQSGFQRHRHFIGLFNVPVQALTRGQPFNTFIPRNRPIESPFTTHWGYGGHILGGGGRLGYCFTPYQLLWLYNGAPLVAFYDTLEIRRTHSRLNPRRPHGGIVGGRVSGDKRPLLASNTRCKSWLG